MSEVWIDQAVKLIEEHILALTEKDYEKFEILFTPRIRNDVLNFDLFERVLILFEKVPLDIGAIDKNASEIVSENELILRMVKTGRKLCKVSKINGKWLVDDIYWNLEKIMTEEEIEEFIAQQEVSAEPIKLVVPEDDEDLSDYDQFLDEDEEASVEVSEEQNGENSEILDAQEDKKDSEEANESKNKEDIENSHQTLSEDQQNP